MDADHFDAITLSLSTAIPRRITMVGTLGAGLTAFLTRFGIDSAEAKKKKRKKKKCKGGKKKCGKKCFDLQTDPLHCGSCGNVCDVGRGCADGNCSCPEGEKACGEACIPQIECCADADCGVGRACVDGTCSCLNGFKPCQGSCIANDDCCGECTGGKICQNGACACSAGEVECSETCVDLATDGANCSACGKVCDTGECIHGACTCEGNFDCPGTCICSSREQGAPSACITSVTGQSCNVDTECSLGSICLLTNKCSVACLA